MPKAKITQKREHLRKEFWSDADAWTGENEKGWFIAPRTLPLVLCLLRSKKLSGNTDPTNVYLELLSRHIDSGIIEMTNEGDHSYAAGYEGSRGVRTWQERMKLLETLGFIKSKQSGNQRYKYVLLVHPTKVIYGLHQKKLIPENWWSTYRARQIETKEATYEQRYGTIEPINTVLLAQTGEEFYESEKLAA
jgi:hypothetical protein